MNVIKLLWKRVKLDGKLAAAIHLMAQHESYSMAVGEWIARLDGVDGSSRVGLPGILFRLWRTVRERYWTLLFEAHPEVFQVDREKRRVSLAARARNPRLWHIEMKRKISLEEYMNLPHEEKMEKVTRTPLSDREVKELVVRLSGRKKLLLTSFLFL